MQQSQTNRHLIILSYSVSNVRRRMTDVIHEVNFREEGPALVTTLRLFNFTGANFRNMQNFWNLLVSNFGILNLI